MYGNVLEQVEVLKYLGCLMSQDDDNIQAICVLMQKARATWARIGQVLWSENASPYVAARFYQVVIQAILLYGSESWVISQTTMVRLRVITSGALTGWLRRISPRMDQIGYSVGQNYHLVVTLQ